jgi:hypothetical protein
VNGQPENSKIVGNMSATYVAHFGVKQLSKRYFASRSAKIINNHKVE